ncbi:DUF5753 domain-containing protein [Streptomyces zagrosensis]|uniref:Transcriptional regulator with XRE-family HTH domain n=1 Tax=Streptomyces zagrosensis TaxID=1042984 RepID=A0A7W9QED3_9ACTN|nr:DUF5753 domain-containing protein [Streptomyces zagrosensis]MBB5938494.1 transcriptional regulator with XRE-family HTH domain [Streptomyces zagrosensis]
MPQRPRPSPTLEHRVVAKRLRRVREEIGWSVAQAAEAAGVAHTTVWRLEEAKTSIDLGLIEHLLTLYGLSEVERELLLEQAAAAARPGWWHQRYRPVMSRDYQEWIALESAASLVHIWHCALVPDLFQTPEYTAALHRARHPRHTAEQLDLAVELVAERQRRLARRKARVWAVVSAAALHTTVGTPAVMRAQHQALEIMLRRPRITFQVLPLEAEWHPLTGAPGVRLLRLDADEIGDQVLLDLPGATTIIDAPEQVAIWRQRLDAASAAAGFFCDPLPNLPDLPVPTIP